MSVFHQQQGQGRPQPPLPITVIFIAFISFPTDVSQKPSVGLTSDSSLYEGSRNPQSASPTAPFAKWKPSVGFADSSLCEGETLSRLR